MPLCRAEDNTSSNGCYLQLRCLDERDISSDECVKSLQGFITQAHLVLFFSFLLTCRPRFWMQDFSQPETIVRLKVIYFNVKPWLAVVFGCLCVRVFISVQVPVSSFKCILFISIRGRMDCTTLTLLKLMKHVRKIFYLFCKIFSILFIFVAWYPAVHSSICNVLFFFFFFFMWTNSDYIKLVHFIHWVWHVSHLALGCFHKNVQYTQ